MNQKETEFKRIETEKSYHVPGCRNYQRRKRNAVIFNTHSTVQHEMAKALGSFMLRKWGDIKFDDKIQTALFKLNEAVNNAMKDFVKQEADFICEAVPNEEPDRRVDLVCLDTDTRFEFEMNPKVNKGEGVVTIYL